MAAPRLERFFLPVADADRAFDAVAFAQAEVKLQPVMALIPPAAMDFIDLGQIAGHDFHACAHANHAATWRHMGDGCRRATEDVVASVSFLEQSI